MGKLELYQYGILDEQSDYRAHVCFKERHVYVFKTAEARTACLSGKYPQRSAYLAGESAPTALGFIVPPLAIAGLQRVAIPDNCYIVCEATESPTRKGNKAVEVLRRMFALGLIALPATVKLVTEKAQQITGVDILVQSSVKIEVKCDYHGGVNGTGNLYFQIAERHPKERK